ncbi:MAG: hypothetical protein LBS10_06695 [Gracilibacteraceae bacterium]|jgi:hypothetical protein|nr:hypothetical protein [Gracilibacteraceae bacterium]
MAVYTSDLHNFHKALSKAGVVFPATKGEILKALGDARIQVDFDSFIRAAGNVERMPVESYPNAAAFYNSYIASGFEALKKTIGY